MALYRTANSTLCRTKLLSNKSKLGNKGAQETSFSPDNEKSDDCDFHAKSSIDTINRIQAFLPYSEVELLM
jgi:hypothetical protein